MSEKWYVAWKLWAWRIWHSWLLDNFDFALGYHTDDIWCDKCGREHPDQSLTVPI